MIKNGMRPVHPGEVLRENYLVPLDMSANALAKALNVPSPRVNDVVRERRGITADTAMRLAHYFGGDARSWLNLQAAYDLRIAEQAAGKRIKREVAPASWLRAKETVTRKERAPKEVPLGGAGSGLRENESRISLES